MLDIVTAINGISAYTSGSSCHVTGVVRWYAPGSRLEVMNENTWIPLHGGQVTIHPDPELGSAMEWAKRKMAEEQQLKALCEKHPGLKDVKEKYEVMLALVRENESSEDK